MTLIKWIFYGIVALFTSWIPLIYAIKTFRTTQTTFKEALAWEYSLWWKSVKEALGWE